MFIYIDLELIKDKQDNFIQNLANTISSKEYSMYEHINYPNKSDVNFWWDVEGDYFVFFGEDKKKIIEYFIESCYQRDGKKEEVGKKLVKAGYKIN